jgi:hypothetical protein
MVPLAGNPTKLDKVVSPDYAYFPLLSALPQQPVGGTKNKIKNFKFMLDISPFF